MAPGESGVNWLPRRTMKTLASAAEYNSSNSRGKYASVDKQGFHWKQMSDGVISQATMQSLKARFMGTTWGPSGTDRAQVGPMLAPWTLLSGIIYVVFTMEEGRRNFVSSNLLFYHNGDKKWPSQRHFSHYRPNKIMRKGHRFCGRVNREKLWTIYVIIFVNPAGMLSNGK